MATKTQIAANHRNARRSTGPRTKEGKATVSQNALRHGLTSLQRPPFPSSSRLFQEMCEDFDPATPAECKLVEDLAFHLFVADRADRLLDSELDVPQPNIDLLLILGRYHLSADRSYYRTLEKLLNLQIKRHLQEIGFVSPKTKIESKRR
jgi:hypothetical protein